MQMVLQQSIVAKQYSVLQLWGSYQVQSRHYANLETFNKDHKILIQGRGDGGYFAHNHPPPAQDLLSICKLLLQQPGTLSTKGSLVFKRILYLKVDIN